MFAYCRNMPMALIDPTGHDFLLVNGKPAVGNAYDGSGWQYLEDVGKNIADAAQTPVSIGLGALEKTLQQDKRLHIQKSPAGQTRSKAYLNHGKALKGVKAAGYVVDGALLAWDLHDTWSNDSYTTEQKWAGTGIAVAGTAAGIGVGVLATAALNFWNPVGWGLAAAAGITILGGAGISLLQGWLNRKVGIG